MFSIRVTCVQLVVALLAVTPFPCIADDSDAPPEIARIIGSGCLECHQGAEAEAGLDLAKLPWRLEDASNRGRWIRIHDRIVAGEMPPDPDSLTRLQRDRLKSSLAEELHRADSAIVARVGRGPMRRLNRDEYEQNLRDILRLPDLDIRDVLPEDRVAHRFNKTAESLDVSRVQLTAYLEAAESALHQAIAGGVERPTSSKFRAVGRKLFTTTATFGNRQAMFFARDSKALDDAELKKAPDDPKIEMALFRSAHWPYYGYPLGFVAKRSGRYRIRFSARAVLQQEGFQLESAKRSVAMTFRARKPSGADVSGDVRATGGLFDIPPIAKTFETTIQLRKTETFEYSLLGLPVPLARNVNNGPPTYRYPPFPKGGQPGVAVQWLEIEGPLSAEQWPPPSHRVLFDQLLIQPAGEVSRLPIEVVSKDPDADARRLLRRFAARAARRPVSDESLERFQQLIHRRLSSGASFAEAMLTGYQAFLCSQHVIYLPEPLAENEHYAIASRLSHLLTNSRPDPKLIRHARDKRLRDAKTLAAEANRLINSPAFDRFVTGFTDYWLNLRHIHRDEPDVRLYPEYRFDAYLLESMARETREFFAAMIRDNLSASVLVDSDFTYANDRLANHYGLQPLEGSAMRRVALPPDSLYGGLLTQAAVLKVTSNGSTTSPVLRGAWVMERLLGQRPPPPPTSVPAVEPDIRGAKSIRELLAKHVDDKTCADCHARFDPIGFALESFDVLGARRTHYRSLEVGDEVKGIDRAGHDFSFRVADRVDSSGQLLDGRKFGDIRELKQLLRDEPRPLGRNLLHQFTVYATGSPVRFSDRAEIESILDDCAKHGYRVGDLLRGLIQSRIFLGPRGCVSSD